jgi:ABC-type sugar transport system ATPase subunit
MKGQNMAEPEYILEMNNIFKAYQGNYAVNNATVKIRRGEIHCLLGENGAGKSTLIKILAGVTAADEGQIIFDGKPVEIKHRRDAIELGVGVIFQELNAVDQLTVAQNLTLGEEKTKLGMVNRTLETQNAKKHLDSLGINLDLHKKVGRLTTSEKQMLLISKAISSNAKLIVMDEPTSALSDTETELLFETVKRLQKNGMTFIFVSHRLQDIFRIGERFTVLRDGEKVGEGEIADTSEMSLINMMAGRKISELYQYLPRDFGEETVRLDNVTAEQLIHNVSFSLRKREILGFSGLAGSGKTELAKTIFGVNKVKTGDVYIRGRKVNALSPVRSIRNGVAFVPEERKSEGIVSVLNISDNMSLSVPYLISKMGIVNQRVQRTRSEGLVKKLNVKARGIDQRIADLSGGNQQKVVFGRWLDARNDIYVFDEPTRGIDVGARGEIYKLINQLAQDGASVMLFSSDLPELVGICDRIAVMREGKIAGILDRRDVTQEKILTMAIGWNG